MADSLTVAEMRASLENYSLTPKKDGYYLKFFVELSDGDQILLLNEAIQRVVVLKVSRYRRLAALDPDPTYPDAFLGSDG